MGGIVWLASYPKSGNTWLRAFLHNLLRASNLPADINRMDEMMFGDSQRFRYEQIAGKSLDDMPAEEIAKLVPRVHRAMAASSPNSVFVKTHNRIALNHGVPLISMEWTAAAIYVIRNPLDIVDSLADHFGLTLDGAIDMLNDPAGGTLMDAANVAEIYGTWSDHVEGWTRLRPEHLHVVRYEDMLDKPNKTFGGVARFLGVNPPSNVLKKAIANSSFKVLQNQEQRHGFKEKSVSGEKFFRVGKSGKWRKILSDDQVARLCGAHREQMGRFGYLPDNFS